MTAQTSSKNTGLTKSKVLVEYGDVSECRTLINRLLMYRWLLIFAERPLSFWLFETPPVFLNAAFTCPATWHIFLIRPASLQGISGEPAHIIYFHTSNKHPKKSHHNNFNDTFQMVIHVFFCNMLSAYKQKKVQNLTETRRFFRQIRRLIRRMEKAQVPKAASHSDGRLARRWERGSGCWWLLHLICLYIFYLPSSVLFLLQAETSRSSFRIFQGFISTLIVNKYMYNLPMCSNDIQYYVSIHDKYIHRSPPKAGYISQQYSIQVGTLCSVAAPHRRRPLEVKPPEHWSFEPSVIIVTNQPHFQKTMIIMNHNESKSLSLIKKLMSQSQSTTCWTLARFFSM